MPEFVVEFFAFANLNNTIRLREGGCSCASPICWKARPRTSSAIAHILLAKIYRKPIERRTRRAIAATFPAARSPRRRTCFARCAAVST